MGVMQEIRDLLAEGMTVAEVIEEGHARSSAYKAAKQVRQSQGDGAGRSRRSGAGRAIVLRQGQEAERQEAQLRDEIKELQEERDTLQKELEKTREYVNGCERNLKAIPGLRAQIASLGAEAEEAARLRERVKDLEGQLQRESHGHAEMRQSASQWRAKFEAEGASRRHAEQQLQQRCVDEHAARMKAEEQWEIWSSRASELDRLNQVLQRKVTDLEPLQVWDRHPCKVCGTPMSGAVSRETAAKVMKEFGHTTCLEKQGSGGLLLAGLAGLAVVSQMRRS